jgi:hypothetical protein
MRCAFAVTASRRLSTRAYCIAATMSGKSAPPSTAQEAGAEKVTKVTPSKREIST